MAAYSYDKFVEECQAFVKAYYWCSNEADISMALEILSDDDMRRQILPRHYHTQLIIKIGALELSILFNHVANLPDLYISS